MHPATAPRIRTLVLLFLAVIGALLLGAAPVSAHAALTGSDPEQGAVVDAAPTRISLTFSERIAVNDDAVRVLDPQGERVDTGDEPTNPSGTTYTVELHGGLSDGTYTVAYQVVSADSHPVAGAFTFSVGAPSETSVSLPAPGSGAGPVGVLYGIGRYVSYAGFVVMAGGAAFVLACWRRGSGVRAVQRLVVSGWLALTAATLTLLLVRGSYTTSGEVGDIADLTLLGEVLRTRSGAALVSRLLLLAMAALCIAVLFGAHDRREENEKRRLSAGLATAGTVVTAGIAASWATSEHASQGLQPGVAMPVDVLHLLAVAAWLGGLTALLVALFRAPAETPVERDAVRRFSRLAFGSVVTLVATGIYQSWRQLGSWSAFTDTRYGQLLAVKIGLVVVLVGVASVSRRWTARLTEGPGSAASAKDTSAATAPAQEAAPGSAPLQETAGTPEGTPAPSASAPGTAPETSGALASGAPAGAVAAGPGGRTAAAQTGSGDAETPEAGSAREAQLARQRAAREAARQKRLRDADHPRSALRRSVLAEAGIAVVLLAVTTVLTQTEPGRTAQQAAAGSSASSTASASAGQGTGPVSLAIPFDTGGRNGRGVVSVDLQPARAGDNALHVRVAGPDGRPMDIPEVKTAFTLSAKDLGPLSVVPDRIATGHWSASGVQLPMAGDWTIEVTVRTSDIDQVTLSKNAQIG